jgi:hypothetical protein
LDDTTPLPLINAKHLDLLINYVRTTYATTTQRLDCLLPNGEITYDLLWALFKPNSLVYTTCNGTRKPRGVKCNFGEEKETSSGAKYWNIACQYLDFDGEEFGEASINLGIVKFRGVRRINTLEAFPLQYHPDEKRVRADLVKCGRKFVFLIGTHYCHLQGKAFYMEKGEPEPVRILINSRIMVDAAFFRKINPNYFMPKVTSVETVSYNLSDFAYDPLWKPPAQVKSKGVNPAEITEDKLLICSPTISGFSFGDKLWGEILPP